MSLRDLVSGDGCEGGNALSSFLSAIGTGEENKERSLETPTSSSFHSPPTSSTVEPNTQAITDALASWNLGSLGNFEDRDWDDALGQEWQHERPPYSFLTDNHFVNLPNAFERGIELFQQGNLDDAVLAFQGHIQQARNSPSSASSNLSDVWRWLGTAHAENDDDGLAIQCLRQAIVEDPENLEALLDLGVSHTNELEQDLALSYLREWLFRHPDYSHLVPPQATEAPPTHEQVVTFYMRAKDLNPNDSDLYTVLGVLFNLSRDFGEATKWFSEACRLDPTNYSLWNKLGATRANSPSPTGSKAAVYDYRKALELKPNYVRAWVNMGISYANQGNYPTSAKYYLRALSLNPNVSHIKSYLRICFSCMEREDLAQKVDLGPDAFRDEFEF